MTFEEEQQLLNSPWTPGETAVIARARPGFIRPDGSVAVSRREMRELASRYPTMFEDAPAGVRYPSMVPPRVKLTGNAERDALAARYPTMFRE